MNNDKIEGLKLALENDIDACDIKWTLFVSAAQSYRYDSQLKPFPMQYSSNRNDISNAIDSIINIIMNVPPFSVLLEHLNEKNYSQLKPDTIDLLYWVIVHLRDPVLKSIQKNDFERVLKKVQSVTECIKPQYIFEVIPSNQSMVEQKFQQYAKDYKSYHAFHGSKLDSFHSILHFGLQQHLCKSDLFGPGIYLSSEMHVSTAFSSIGAGWDASRCGKELSCIAICELIEHPIHLQHHAKNTKTAVPDKYFLITNNEIVRIRYLLIFAKKRNVNAMNEGIVVKRSAIMNWIMNHKPLMAVCFYTILLISIGLANSQKGAYFRHIFWRKTIELFQFVKNSLAVNRQN